MNGRLTVSGNLMRLAPGQHGIHVHQNGDLANACAAAGAHFNPAGVNHGAPTANPHHVGDMGNIRAGNNNVAAVMISNLEIPLSGPNSVLGRAIVVHANPDDLGLGGTPLSLTTGNSGRRVACGVIVAA
ncbi:hypothetical protein AB6A40_006924 [Gnathostoma spinigerum]|uniref:Superoxide dismutase [Cu-Zn] n=1 Tax=Gnathostoma spinigerum TaxID=75299 RepID=A0ABD6EKY6_9BILA